MTFQQYIQQKKLDISIVNLQDLENHNRFDAEFYAVDILLLRKKLKENGAKKLGFFSKYIKRGVQPKYNVKGNIKVLRSVNIREQGFSDNRQEFIEEDFYNSKKQSQVNYLDIFMTSTGIGTLGRVGISLNKNKYFIDSHITKINKLNGILPEFLFVYLNSTIGQKQINTLYKGSSGQIEIYPDDIEEILIPEISFQTQIANLVQKFYLQKELGKKLFFEAEKLLLSELGLDNYIITENNISIKDSKEINLSGRFDSEYFQSKYDNIIDKIKTYKGGYDILENLIDISNKKIKKQEYESFNYIELSDINPSLGIVNNSTEILSQNLPSRAKMKIKTGDVLVSSVAGSADKIAIITNEVNNLVASTGFFILGPKFFNSETNLILMKSWIYKNLLIRSARGMILEATNKNDFLQFILPKIDLKIQEKIAKLVKKSHIKQDLSKKLLEKAKKSVEIFIEGNEKKAVKFLNNIF